MKYVLHGSLPRAREGWDAELNPQQRAVVEADPGEILVLAGAGTGKTRTLTYRVARLVATGTPPERILLCTFTNRAAREMVGRVEELLGIDMRACHAGTFHHVGHRILRSFGEHLGLDPEFGILDPEDARQLLSTTIAEQGLQTLTARRFPTPKLLQSILGLAAGMERPVGRVIEAHHTQLVPQLPAIDAVVARYEARKRSMNVVDFDDLLVLWGALLHSDHSEGVGTKLRALFDHVLVDEYQDIDHLQGRLCDAMAATPQSLTCVGDDAQSIYSFRGADFAQIHEFTVRHPKARVLELTLNYRSTPQILELANRSIAHNRAQHPKALQAVCPPGPLPAVIPVRDVFQQAEFVAQRVLELHHEHARPLSRMAVLYRNHSHSLELQIELGRRQIPFAVRSGVRFFEQAHVKDTVAYLRARENPQDELAWIRLLRLWPGIGAHTAQALAAEIRGAVGHEAPSRVLRREAASPRSRQRATLDRLADLLDLLAAPTLTNPGEMVRAVVAQHYGDYIERTFTNAAARKDDLEHLAAFAQRYPAAREFLAELALVSGLAAESILGGAPRDDLLVLSTIHQAKGLEWSACFVVWLAEGRFPMAQVLWSPEQLEEERRLFYVAVTRAADELYLCYPTIEDGRDGPKKLLRASRFLAELDGNPAAYERWRVEEEPA